MPNVTVLDYDENDFALKFRFNVQISDINSTGFLGGFSKISGLREEIEVVDQRDGIDPLQTRKLVGTHAGSDCTLEKGVFGEKHDILQWFKDTKGTSDGIPPKQGFKRTVKVMVLGADGELKRTITLLRAWPKSYELSDLDASSSELALESLVLTFEDMDIN
jgi:phage tail-like protein